MSPPEPVLSEAARAVLAKQAPQLNPDKRTQPTRQVVDRWEGLDALECGHLIPPGYTHRPHRRRCPYCPPIVPASTFRVVAEAEVLDWFAGFSDERRGELLAELRAREGDQD